MKNTKRIIILALTVLLVALCATVAIIAADTSADFSEDLKSHQVSLNGRVNLMFKYNSLGRANAYVAETYAPGAENPTATYTYMVDEIPTEKNTNVRVISVPLAPSQMTYSVKVYPVSLNENGEVAEKGEVDTYSVKQYAESLLGNDSYAKYHNMVRALLNWGAMAQEFFKAEGTTIAPAELANVGLYTRDTNPIDAVGADTITVPKGDETTVGDAFEKAGAELFLATNDVYLELYVYARDTTCTAEDFSVTLNRDGFDEAKVLKLEKVEGEDGKFKITIENISVTLYDKVYTLTVTAEDGSTLKASASVLKYLDGMVELTTTTEAQKNTAKSLYQFYTLAMTNVHDGIAATCKHTASHWRSNGADASYIECSACFEELSRAIGDNINTYLDNRYLQIRPQQGTYKVTPEDNQTDGDTSFMRIKGQGQTGEIFWTRIFNEETGPDQINPIDVGSAKYLVVKMRGQYSATGVKLMIGTIKGDATADNLANQKTAAIYLPISELSATEWTTFAIPLDNKTMSAGWITDADNSTNHKVTYLDFTMAGTFSSEMYLDFAYIAFADDFKEVTELADTETIEQVYKAKSSVEYSLKEDAVNAYIDANSISTGGETFRTNTFTLESDYCQITSKEIDYTAANTIWTRQSDKNYPFNVGSAKYLVLKMRGTVPVTSIQLGIGTLNAEGTQKTAGVNLPLGEFNSTNWTTFVIQLDSTLMSKGWVTDANGTYTVSQFMITYNDSDKFAEQMTLDFGYVAFVDDWSEIKALCGTETVEFITASETSSTYSTVGLPSKADGNVNAYLDAEYLSTIIAGGIPVTYNTDYSTFTSTTGSTPTDRIWTRPGFGTSNFKPFSVGEATYFVVKMRGQCTSGTIRIGIGTTTGELVYSTAANNNVGAIYTSFTIPTADKLSKDEWTTYVIKLDGIKNYKNESIWNVHGNGEYIVSQLSMLFQDPTNKFPVDEQGNPAISLDIAYMAFVDSWDEVAEISDTATVEYITSTAGACETLNENGSALAK